MTTNDSCPECKSYNYADKGDFERIDIGNDFALVPYLECRDCFNVYLSPVRLESVKFKEKKMSV